jgi:DnaJ-domain-containing protein 1
VEKDIFKDKKLLTRFIRQLCSSSDTPALIQFVAGDEDYLRLCRNVVNASADDSRDLGRLKEICRAHGIDFYVLKEKLMPVTRALELALSPEMQIDYYELLGIPQSAEIPDIKKAFRQKARGVHPDTSRQGTKSSREFIHLKTAYQILRHPVLRQQYDQSLLHVDRWREKANKTVIQNRPARTRIFYQLGGIFLLLIIAVFIFDFLYRP